MKRKTNTRIKVERLSKEATKAIQDVQNYLEIEKGRKAEYSDIIVASLKIAQRMGLGMYGIYLEIKEEGGKTE